MISYKTVVFDFDGTLVDSGPGILQTLRLLIEELGLRKLSEEEMNSLIGPPINVAYPQMFGVDDPDEIEKMLTTYRRIFREVAQPMLQAFAGIPALLQALVEAGITTCVATCKTQHVCEEQAAALGILPWLQHVCGARPEAGLFEKGDIIRTVMQEAGVSYENAIMVGDRMHDLEGAAFAGLPAIAVTYGCGTEAEFAPYHPRHIVHSVQELRALLLP